MSSDPQPVGALESHLGFWLRHVSNQVSHAFAARLQGREVTVAEWVVMRELYDADQRPSALADRLGMTRGAITKLADRLSAKGFVMRAPSGEDGRAHDLALTAAGRALLPDLARLADDNDAAFFGHLDAPTRAAIEAALREIVRRSGTRTVPID